MTKKLFALLVALVFTLILVMPASSVSGNEGKHIDFTATSSPDCSIDPSFCELSDHVIMKFTATDPRWNANCYFIGDPTGSGSALATPSKGSFTCYATDPQYVGGWWEGTVRIIWTPDKVNSTFNAKGYGTLDGLLVNVHSEIVEGVFINTGTIIELPWYKP